MMRELMLGVATAAALGLSPVPTAVAQSMPPSGVRMPCHNAIEIAKQLHSKYDEAPVAFGLQSNGHLLQVYSSKEKGTWTVVTTSPNGVSCIVAAGKSWQALPHTPDGPLA